MAMDAQARTAAPDVPAREDDYEALLAALSAGARGRAFLAEFARRNRTADTEIVLTALKRLEERMAAQAAAAETAPTDGERPRLAMVPPPDEPQLPIPSPAAQRPPIALAHSNAAASEPSAAATIPEVSWFGDAPADEPDAPAAAPVAAKPLPAVEPFAALMALTEEERIALFS